MLNVESRTRDPRTGQIHTASVPLDPARVAVINVDPWNYHWCMTACERVGAMAPRWRWALECARRLGMQVIWLPSDVLGSYSGWPQRETALALPRIAVPKVRELPDASVDVHRGPCMCGPGISCLPNYGHDAITPELPVLEQDLMAADTAEVYAILQQHRVTHVIYMGLHTNICLYGKPGALKWIHEAGVNCLLCRDINDAMTRYDPATGFTPDQGTRQTDDQLEQAGIPTIDFVAEMQKVWDSDTPLETVRIVPWGKPMRPFFFEKSVTVTLTAPWLGDAQIRYCTQGRAPTMEGPVYEKPLVLTQSATLHAAAFRGRERISLVTDACWTRLPPLPPKPDVPLDQLTYIADPYAQVGPVYAACFWLPKVGQSYEGRAPSVRATRYAHGLGFRAPSSVRYALEGRYRRFVARAGVDDNMLGHELGRNLAAQPAILFKVFIDGICAAQSPVMRISQEPWRFDVPIPPGSRHINIVCTNARARTPLDGGNWVDAGFVL